jgi:hypothetical protein
MFSVAGVFAVVLKWVRLPMATKPEAEEFDVDMRYTALWDDPQ